MAPSNRASNYTARDSNEVISFLGCEIERLDEEMAVEVDVKSKNELNIMIIAVLIPSHIAVVFVSLFAFYK